MSALTAARAASVREVTRDKRPLAAGAKVYRGGLCVAIVAGTSKGFYKQGVSGAVCVAVGRFYEDADNTSGADGDVSVDVHFFRERHLFLLNNDTGTAVAAGDRETGCYVLDDQTVTMSASSARAGVVYDVVTGEGVWVEVEQAANPSIQYGTTTLVSGTKTVTGVKLTANSIIQLTMRDPGAGALTTFIALDAPVASRNVGSGQFVINAIDNAKAVLATAVPTVDYTIFG